MKRVAAKKGGAKKKRGPASGYTPKLGEQICELIACGSNLRRISVMPGMPSVGTLLNWLTQNPEFSEQYARSRETRADSRADRIDEIGFKLERGEIDANTARVLVDIEKWQAGKEKPKRYGDKIDVNANFTGDVNITVGGDAS